MSYLGPLNAIITELTGYLAANYTGFSFQIGEENLDTHAVPPRIVFVPTHDSYSSARLQKVEPRPVKTRNAGCQAHIWNSSGGSGAVADLSATEQLVNDTIAALHLTAHGAYQIVSGIWQRAGLGQLGRGYVLEFSVEIPITMAAFQSVTPTSVPETVKMPLPDGSTEIEGPF